MRNHKSPTTSGECAPRFARAGAPWRIVLVTGLAFISIAGCSSILDVENPNNIAEESLGDPSAAAQQANGVLASTVRMLSAVTTPYATATDELDWIGSRDAWNDLETGALSNYLNEFTDVAFPFVGEARFHGDETIKRLEAFRTAGSLRDPTNLARTYLYTAITYATIADMFDDFAFSNKTVPGPAIGRANMGRLYDTAVEYLDKALAIVVALPAAQRNSRLQYAIVATRARTKHAKAAWALVTPKGTTPANPLVNVVGAVTDARAALALGTPDERFQLFSNVEAQPDINVFFEVNGRNEMQIGEAFRRIIARDTIYLFDPLSGAEDPVIRRLVSEFEGPETSSQEGYFTIVSNRELHLIIAEAALAAGDVATFTAEINRVRAFDGLPAYSGQIPPLQILKHERKVNLFLQRRRLIDLYRFGEKVAEWTTNANFESAFNVSGLLFPIPNIERQANPCIANPGACGAP